MAAIIVWTKGNNMYAAFFSKSLWFFNYVLGSVMSESLLLEGILKGLKLLNKNIFVIAEVNNSTTNKCQIEGLRE